MEDSLIIKLYFDRSERAIEETDKKYGSCCKSISYNILNNHQDAEECVNDTYFSVWNAIPPKNPNSFFAFLSKITRNISLNRLKFKNTKKRGDGEGEFELICEELDNLLTSESSVEDQFDSNRLSEIINDFVGKLPIEKRTVFIGRYWYFDSIDAISKKTGFSSSKIKMLLFRTRKQLKKLLDKEGIKQ